MPQEDGKKAHASRQATEAKAYERLREAGAGHDFARARAERSSELTHRSQDKLNSDRNPRRKDR